jgi:hypothetical protein
MHLHPVECKFRDKDVWAPTRAMVQNYNNIDCDVCTIVTAWQKFTPSDDGGGCGPKSYFSIFWEFNS